MTELKKCISCLEEKELTFFYFRKDNNKYKSTCKKCIISGKKKYRELGMKVCKHCNENKPICEYQKAGGGKWLQPYCFKCDSERKRKWAEDNSERLKKKHREYYENVGKYKYVPRPRIIKTKEEVLENRRRYANLPHVKAKKSVSDKKYREKYANKIQESKLKYKLSGRAAEISRLWQQRQMNDIESRIKKNLRGRVYVALKRGIKSVHTMELLGCSIAEFRTRFESKFTDGMNWEKYMRGEIHIDHIKPCAEFVLTDHEQQKICFHYSNLRPLWKLDNLKKGIRYEP